MPPSSWAGTWNVCWRAEKHCSLLPPYFLNLGFKYPVNWFRGREDERTAPLRRVLRAARHTEFYCDWIPDNGLRSPWIVLQSLPPITPDLLPVCVGDVSRAARSRLRRPRICCPLKPPPPISVLLNGAAIGHHEAVAAPVGRLRELAAAHALPT